MNSMTPIPSTARPEALHSAPIATGSAKPTDVANTSRVLPNTYALLSMTLLFSAAIAAASVADRQPSLRTGWWGAEPGGSGADEDLGETSDAIIGSGQSDWAQQQGQRETGMMHQRLDRFRCELLGDRSKQQRADRQAGEFAPGHGAQKGNNVHLAHGREIEQVNPSITSRPAGADNA